MRLLFVTNGLRYGGAEMVIETLAKGCLERGDEVRVVATTRDGIVGEHLRAGGIGVDLLGIRSAFDARVVWRLAQITRAFAPDLIHSHLSVADIATAMSRSIVGTAPVIATTVHNPGVELSRAKRTLWLRALKQFDHVWAVSEAVRTSLPSALNPIVLRPCLASTTTAADRTHTRARLGVRQSDKLVLAVGRLARVKGFDVLKAAAEALPHNTRIILVGDGPEAAALGGGRLELLGTRDDVDDLLAAADVVVCPSRSEGFPQVPLQAMALGTPVVASNVGGMSELVLPGKTGILVQPEAPSALAHAINDLLADPGKQRELGRSAAASIRERGFMASNMIHRSRAAYRSAIDLDAQFGSVKG